MEETVSLCLPSNDTKQSCLTRQVALEWGLVLGCRGWTTASSLTPTALTLLQGEGMLHFCQGDSEGWVVVGPRPVPGIWVTMETA